VMSQVEQDFLITDSSFAGAAGLTCIGRELSKQED
jgi:hypothetical protein